MTRMPVRKSRFSAVNPITMIALGGLMLLLLAPVFAVLASFWAGDGETQGHIWATTGPIFLRGTILLCLLVGGIAGLLGFVTAALVSLTDMPGRKLLSFLLALPFAVPAYIMAYCYGDFLSPFGGFAALFGAVPPALNVGLRTYLGGAFILSLAVYPYVYLAVRADLEARSSAYLEAASTLGVGPWGGVIRVLVPGARAAFLGGLALALMETTADYGVSDYFGLQTLSTGIFRTWYGLGDLNAAAQIAGALFLVAALLLIVEEIGRRGQRSEPARAHRKSAHIKLSLPVKIAAIVICMLPVLCGFVIPVCILVAKLGDGAIPARKIVFVMAAGNTLGVAMVGAVIAMALAMTLAWQQRVRRSHLSSVLIRLMTIGYAIPGAVIAVGILLIGGLLLSPAGLNITSGGVFLLGYAYIIRFLTAGYNNTAGGLAGINPIMDMAARSLGQSPVGVVRQIHLPLASRALLAGLVIVFIDISRELPATLLLRPFNFETLATQVYRLASDERLAAASPAALMLILLGLIPVLLLTLLPGKRQR